LDSCGICGGPHCNTNSYGMTFGSGATGGYYTQSTAPDCNNSTASVGSGCNSTTCTGSCCYTNSPCYCNDGHAYPNC
jgi:hypothetical protein